MLNDKGDGVAALLSFPKQFLFVQLLKGLLPQLLVVLKLEEGVSQIVFIHPPLQTDKTHPLDKLKQMCFFQRLFLF